MWSGKLPEGSTFEWVWGISSIRNSRCYGPREGSSSAVVIAAGRPKWLELISELSPGPGRIG